MGCVETRSTSEETAVLEAEKGLRFHLEKSVRIDSTIRKFSSNGKINCAQLQRISEVLNIQISDNPPHTKIEDMFRKLISSEGLYEMKDLLVMGILLSEGEAGVKAGLLYQVFDEDLTNKIPISKCKDEVLARLTAHSCKILPSLVTQEQTKVSNTIKNEKYISDMEQVKSTCIESVAGRLAVNGNFVTESTFVEVFRTLNLGSLTSSSGWRRFLIETFKTSPPKKTFTNPYKKK